MFGKRTYTRNNQHRQQNTKGGKMDAKTEVEFFFNEFLAGPRSNGPCQAMVRHLQMSLRNGSIDIPSIVRFLIRELTEAREDLVTYMQLNGKPAPIQLSADTEEGKQLIKNLMEMYKKKEE